MSFSKYHSFDAATGLLIRDVGQAAITSDGYVGTEFDQGAAAATDMICVINIEALDIGDDDEYGHFTVVGYNESDKSDRQILGKASIGAAAAIALETVDSAAGDRHEIRFRTEKNGTKFRYVALHLDVGGTGATFTFNAYMTREM